MDTFLTFGSAIVELGLPALLVYFLLKKPDKRNLLVPVLGAVTPMVLFLIIGTIDYYLFPSEEPSMFLAAFAMVFLMYCVLAVVGLLAGVFLPKTVKLHWRYIIGLVLGPVFGWGLITVW